MKRLIFGKGKVSNIISRTGDVVLSREDCDICDASRVKNILLQISPDVVINCAAKTNLEYCQENKGEAYMSNTAGIINLLDACSKMNIKFVHISSGCLFDGNGTLSTEESAPTPAVWYTWTKKWADEIIENFGYENYLILRPRQLISRVAHPSNMLTKFSKLEKIRAIDEPNSLTCIEDFGEMIEHLLKIDATGIFNCCNTGVVSPYQIAVMMSQTITPQLEVEHVSYDELLSVLPNKRVNTILSVDKLINAGFQPRSAENALMWCLENYCEQD